MRLRARSLFSNQLVAFTGLTPYAFGMLVERLWVDRPDRRLGRPWALTFPDRVLLSTLALRTNLTFEQLAVLFGVSDSTVHRVVADLTERISALLGPPPRDRRELWIVDGTLVPQRDRSRTARSKNYRRSVNVQIVARARDGRVVAVGASIPGNRNDTIVFRESLA